MTAPDASELERLGRKLWGEPNQRLSTRYDLRFGSHGSKSINLKTGEWFDHESGEGGSYASLLARVNGRTPPHDQAPPYKAYDYQDAEGNLTYQVVRRFPKSFRQRRPDGRGGWIWNLDGVARVLYRLPELLKTAPDATIYIVEGEKDVEALRERLLIATTNPGGAGKWLPEYSEHFRGRAVVVLPDNDEVGEAHALDIERMLRGIARSVRILRLPGLPSKGDVSDWLADGGTAKE